MSEVQKQITNAMVALVRRVPWGPSRLMLEQTAGSLRQKAIWERGMCDNHDTAEILHADAEIYMLAAEVRFPRPGDGRVREFHDLILKDLLARCGTPCDEDEYDVESSPSRVQCLVTIAVGEPDGETLAALENELSQLNPRNTPPAIHPASPIY